MSEWLDISFIWPTGFWLVNEWMIGYQLYLTEWRLIGQWVNAWTWTLFVRLEFDWSMIEWLYISFIWPPGVWLVNEWIIGYELYLTDWRLIGQWVNDWISALFDRLASNGQWVNAWTWALFDRMAFGWSMNEWVDISCIWPPGVWLVNEWMLGYEFYLTEWRVIGQWVNEWIWALFDRTASEWLLSKTIGYNIIIMSFIWPNGV